MKTLIPTYKLLLFSAIMAIIVACNTTNPIDRMEVFLSASEAFAVQEDLMSDHDKECWRKWKQCHADCRAEFERDLLIFYDCIYACEHDNELNEEEKEACKQKCLAELKKAQDKWDKCWRKCLQEYLDCMKIKVERKPVKVGE